MMFSSAPSLGRSFLTSLTASIIPALPTSSPIAPTHRASNGKNPTSFLYIYNGPQHPVRTTTHLRTLSYIPNNSRMSSNIYDHRSISLISRATIIPSHLRPLSLASFAPRVTVHLQTTWTRTMNSKGLSNVLMSDHSKKFGKTGRMSSRLHARCRARGHKGRLMQSLWSTGGPTLRCEFTKARETVVMNPVLTLTYGGDLAFENGFSYAMDKQ